MVGESIAGAKSNANPGMAAQDPNAITVTIDKSQLGRVQADAAMLFGDSQSASVLGASSDAVQYLAQREAAAKAIIDQQNAQGSGQSSGRFLSSEFEGHYQAVSSYSGSVFELRQRQSEFAAYRSSLGENPSQAQRTDIANYEEALRGDEANLNRALAVADRSIGEIGRAGLAPFDIASGGYNIATGNAGFRDYLAVASVVPVGKVLGAFRAAERAVTFPNLAPLDQLARFNPFPISSIQRGYTGKLEYVVLESGELVFGKNQGHINLSRGADVLAAGEAKFFQGAVKKIDNMSGHYRPSGSSAQSAAEAAFNRSGFNADGRYVERKF